MKKKRIGLYPGSFDPVTNGHLDIIFRAHKLVDELVIGVAKNQKKENLFSMEKRKKLILHEINKSKYNKKSFKVVIFDGLLMNFAKSINANLIVRGLRAVSDYEYELQMSLMNSQLLHGCETIFMVADSKWSFVSSRLIKEVALLGGDFSEQVPASILDNIKKRIQEKD